MSKILIIDDEKSIRNTLKEILEYEKYEVEEAEDGMTGLAMLEKGGYDVVLCDIKMPRMDGMEVLVKILEMTQDTSVVMISGHGNIETAVEAIKKGAFDYISKPLDLNRLLISIRNALERSGRIQEIKKLRKQIGKKKSMEMIGESEAIQNIRAMIKKVAPSDSRVLITGENGTGKELVARELHSCSNRSDGPFIEVNCAAIPSELIESELFGHEKGSFTSAIKQRNGKFELANNGTIFLDEIGDMSMSAQAKVLRALQENKITRVGGDKDIKVNTRVIAATNKDLKKLISEQKFREDLYHRLGVIIIHVASLNKRRDDIPILAKYFLEQICDAQGLPKKKISQKAMDALQKRNWSGNIRELHNVIERLVILGGDEISEADVKTYVTG